MRKRPLRRYPRDGSKAIAAVCDVSDRAPVRTLEQTANAAFGLIQIVIPNAGATSFKPMTALTDDEIDWIVQVNFMGAMNFLQTFLPDMIAAGDGHIVSSASVAALVPILMQNHVPYSAAKAGVIGMSLNLCRELEGTGVQSTAFFVASLAVDMKDQNSLYWPERYGAPYKEDIARPTTFKRGGPRAPAEVSPMVIEPIRNNRSIPPRLC